jgi:acyl-CoA thioesterase
MNIRAKEKFICFTARAQKEGTHMADMTSEKVKKLLEEKDRLLRHFGMEVCALNGGNATVRMTVKEEHLNAAQYCHGGVLFSLADVAFALASNSYGKLAVALDMSISFIKAVPPGAVLTAYCSERHRGKSTGSYTIEIRDEEDNLVSLLKATSFRVGTPIV